MSALTLSGAPPRRLRTGAALLASLGLLLAPLSQAAAQSGERNLSLIRDAEIEAILRHDADPIFRAAGLNPPDIRINLVQSDELNAGASAQQMFLFTGMILAADDPDQLRGVIAHETGHIAGGHSARSGDMMRAGMQPMILALALGVLAAAAGRPDAGLALLGSSNYFATLSVLSYSRVQEAAADQAAATYLERAGMSGRGLTSFFRKYQFQEVFSQARRFAYFQSHPISAERIASLTNRVQAASHLADVADAEAIARHRLMQAKLQAFLRPPGHTLARYAESDRGVPARYARAIAYFRDAQPDRAVTILDTLIAEQPNNPYFHELKGQIYFESGRLAESEAPYRRAVELLPESALLRFGLGQTLVALGGDNLDDAMTHLQIGLSRENDSLMGWRLLGQAYDAKGMPGLARLAAAEERFHGNDLSGSRIFATRARALLAQGSREYRRATDILMASRPTRDELRDLATEERVG